MFENLKEITKTKLDKELVGDEMYVFHLFVSGKSPSSARAIENLKVICENYFKGKCELKIIDIYEQPDLAYEEKIIAIPILIKKFPLPEKRVIGDLSDFEKVFKGLDLVK